MVLKQRFEHNNCAIKVNINSDLQNMKLDRADHDLEPWITKVESLRRRLKGQGVIISHGYDTIHHKYHTKGLYNHN
jgi:hypothetical protein